MQVSEVPTNDGIQTYLEELEQRRHRWENVWDDEIYKRITEDNKNQNEIWNDIVKIGKLFSEARACKESCVRNAVWA